MDILYKGRRSTTSVSISGYCVKQQVTSKRTIFICITTPVLSLQQQRIFFYKQVRSVIFFEVKENIMTTRNQKYKLTEKENLKR